MKFTPFTHIPATNIPLWFWLTHNADAAQSHDEKDEAEDEAEQAEFDAEDARDDAERQAMWDEWDRQGAADQQEQDRQDAEDEEFDRNLDRKTKAPRKRNE